MQGTGSDTLSAMPELFQALMARPLVPLTQGRLPHSDAFYVFYIQGEPVLAGSPPHLNELSLLAPSFRGGFSLRISDTARLGLHAPFPERRHTLARRKQALPAPIHARWLVIEDRTQRAGLEVFSAYTLGLSISHPDLRKAASREARARIHQPDFA